jgi:hypothetical protein
VSREAVRKWLKGETFPDLDCLLHLIEWIKLDMSNIFLTPLNDSNNLTINFQKNDLSMYENSGLSEDKIALFNQALNTLININLVQKLRNN